ncbi:MAG: hypothetical protein ABIR57_02670 [Aeromicrobium sp.]
MNPQQDYAALWPDLFQSLPLSTRDTIVHALRTSAEDGTPPDRIDAGILIDFATGRISAREYGQRTLARLMDVPEEVPPPSSPPPPAAPSAPPMSLVPAPSPVFESSRPAAAPESPAAQPATVAHEIPSMGEPLVVAPILDHDEAALAFVRGEVTIEQYLQNARRLRGDRSGM